MKKYIVLFIILFVHGLANGQSSPMSCVLDTALIKVVYERLVVLDTLDSAKKNRIEDLTLQSGKKASVFYSAKGRYEDSIMHANPEYCLAVFRDHSRFKQISELENEVVYKRYDIHQTWTHQRFDLTGWIIYEDLEVPSWEITNEVDMILGFPCIKARTLFRGREWTAFFTPEIPIQEGPRKLWGLPGLILKAYDSKRHYVYEAKEINTVSPGLVKYVNDVERLEIKDRRKALRMRKKALAKDLAPMLRSAYNVKLDPKKVIKSEKIYDFEETDYPHD